MKNELALFAGAGGGLLATKHLLGWQTICYVENDPYRVKVLKARIRDGYLDDAPIWGDARTFDGTPWRGCVDIVTAGFPCQPFSQAGKGLAERDKRNLWPDTIRVIREVRPELVLLENVPRLLCHAYVRRIFADLAESGYDCRWDCVPASAVGANHQRDRLWIVAHTNDPERWAVDSDGCVLEGQDDSIQVRRDQVAGGTSDSSQEVAHTQETKRRRSNGTQNTRRRNQKVGRCSIQSRRKKYWRTEPNMGRVAHGVAHRVDRLAALGDGQVPAVVAAVWRLLTESF